MSNYSELNYREPIDPFDTVINGACFLAALPLLLGLVILSPIIALLYGAGKFAEYIGFNL